MAFKKIRPIPGLAEFTQELKKTDEVQLAVTVFG